MNFGLFGGGLQAPQPVKHKIFISYHHGGDQAYYDAFSNAFHDTYEVIYDNSLERQVDSDDVDYVMRRIRENYITGTSCTIVLVGRHTPWRKYVDWEIKATLDKEHGLIGVRLPTASMSADNKTIVPDRLNDNIASGYALWLGWEQVAASAAHLSQYVAAAKSRSTTLIDNTRDRRLRNG
jgi:MTH538 TIR-like domain (DUF1863)